MLTRLSSVLPNGARPARAIRSDAIATVTDRWSELVGVDAAENARPTNVRFDALIVTVTSNAWAQQISMAAPRILACLSSCPDARSVVRVTYRVGPLPYARPPAAAHKASTDAPSVRPTTPIQKAETVEAAVANLRLTIDSIRSQYIAAGRSTCATCAALIQHGDRCRVCADTKDHDQRLACARLLHRKPASTFELAAIAVPGLTRADFESVRRGRLRVWSDGLKLAAADERPRDATATAHLRTLALAYVALSARGGARVALRGPIAQNLFGDLYPFIVSLDALES